MRKLLRITALAIACALALTACAKTAKEPEGTLSELMDEVYAAVGGELFTEQIEVTEENAAYYLGTTGIPYTEALASEPMISASAHSVVLLRLEKNADIEAAKAKIKENVDPYKWICVGVEADNVCVESIGSLVILVMAGDSENYIEAFRGLAK